MIIMFSKLSLDYISSRSYEIILYKFFLAVFIAYMRSQKLCVNSDRIL